ncbi:MAG TPA: YajQ family cyclic di-GMP-binding protein [Nitrolancea sp.]|nr:YajQ family cyclic di-GMP-binding protein [Nitrolancea sp.]
MAAASSFDIVSDFDLQELRNAIGQAMREITTRYDLKDSNTEIALEKDQLVISTADEFILGSVTDILDTRVIRRGLSLKILDYQKVEDASGSRVRQVVKLRRGIPETLAKQLVKEIRTENKKVTPQIQGDAIRVTAKNKDDLQAVIQLLKAKELDVALQFINYR